MNEEWRAISGWEGRYEVSNLGRIRSLSRITIASNGRPRPVVGRILKLMVNPKGYHWVHLGSDRNHTLVHIVMCEAFHGPKPEGHEVRHLNGNPSDNTLSNLKWGTKKENMADKNLHGTHNKGERSATAKLTESIVREIREKLSEKTYRGQLADLGREYGISWRTIWDIREQRSWKDLV